MQCTKASFDIRMVFVIVGRGGQVFAGVAVRFECPVCSPAECEPLGS